MTTITTYCIECMRPLKHEIHKHLGDLEIAIEPCKDCLKKAKDETASLFEED